LATFDRVTGGVRATRSRIGGVAASTLRAGILGAAHRIITITGRATRAARRGRLVSGRATRLAFVAQRGVLTRTGHARVLGARVVVVALGILAALRAAGAGAAHLAFGAGGRDVITQRGRCGTAI